MQHKKITHLVENFRKRNMQGIFCENRSEALSLILESIPPASSVGFSGSMTLESLGVIKQLEARGNKVFNPYQEGINKEESLNRRKLGAQAEFYLASANAVSLSGELVFFSGWGNRTAGVSNAKNAIIVCGLNKITPDLPCALKRAREYATPLNCKRLGNWKTPCLEKGSCQEEICFPPKYKRMCCQVLVIESEVTFGRLKVVLVGEDLGF